MDKRGLLFIPDISGFSRFVTETEIDHSRLIIQELLEILINSNEIGLEVSEVEGDAILFYKFGETPELQQLYQQVEKMFCEFHKNITSYEIRRFCQCKACASAIKLTLKIITHYGEFTGYNVKNFNKLIGKDVIVAHQLMKNDIEDHEYWLVTEDVLRNDALTDFKNWMKWNTSTKKTDAREVPFHYTKLSDLRKEITPDPPFQVELSRMTKMFSLSKEYDGHIITLFHASGNFTYRPGWQDGVIRVEEISHFLPRVGMKYRSIKENGETIMYASSVSFRPDRIEFGETDENKTYTYYFTLERIEEYKTRVTIDYYIEKNPVNQILFKLFREKALKSNLEKSMRKLENVVKEVNVPVEY